MVNIVDCALDKQTKKWLQQLAKSQKFNLRWYWRLAIIFATLSTIASAVFQILGYF